MDRNQDVEVELYEENVGNIALLTKVDRHLQIDFCQFSHPKNPPKEDYKKFPLWLSIRGPILKNCLMLQLLKCPRYTIVVTVVV